MVRLVIGIFVAVALNYSYVVSMDLVDMESIGYSAYSAGIGGVSDVEKGPEAIFSNPALMGGRGIQVTGFSTENGSGVDYRNIGATIKLPFGMFGIGVSETVNDGLFGFFEEKKPGDQLSNHSVKAVSGVSTSVSSGDWIISLGVSGILYKVQTQFTNESSFDANLGVSFSERNSRFSILYKNALTSSFQTYFGASEIISSQLSLSGSHTIENFGVSIYGQSDFIEGTPIFSVGAQLSKLPLENLNILIGQKGVLKNDKSVYHSTLGFSMAFEKKQVNYSMEFVENGDTAHYFSSTVNVTK
ncbi:hypothetical protein HOH45_00135 [bacterium]|jgi:hypothetical protein|nr:hypothetical protein [bacterium]